MIKLDSILASHSIKVARNSQVSYYDAVYIQLSDQMGIPLLTADEKLISRIKNNDGYEYLHLKEFE